MVPFTGFLTAYKYATEDKGREVDGGREGEPVTVNGKLQKRNKFTGEISEYAGGVPLAPQKEQADIGLKKAEEKKNLAEAKKADQADSKPVYAYITQTKQLEQTTRSTVAANPTLYTNPVEVKESDIRKDTELARQLGDAQLNLSRYRVAASKLDDLGRLPSPTLPNSSEKTNSEPNLWDCRSLLIGRISSQIRMSGATYHQKNEMPSLDI